MSEYGIKKVHGVKSAKRQKFADEKGFYRALGMAWIPPELREDTGEIEAAQQDKLPQLVKLAEIKGDLHVHSNFEFVASHDLGEDAPEAMVKKAREMGYQYLGFSEHNPSRQYKSIQVLDIIKRKKETIEKLSYSNNISILNGLEVDILNNGRLSIDDQALEQLDFAIVSIHANFRFPKQKMTARILAGLNHPKVKILGHPTGRQIGTRESYEADWEKIFTYCRQKEIWLEINAWPERLDLPDFLVREAVKNGVKMVINTDSHALSQMALMNYGVAVARRGWAEAQDIINTLPWSLFSVKLNHLKGGEQTK